MNVFVHVYRPEYPKRTQIQKLFLEMHKLAQQHFSQLLPILMPELGQVDPKTIPNLILQPEQLDLDEPQCLLMEFFHRHHFSLNIFLILIYYRSYVLIQRSKLIFRKFDIGPRRVIGWLRGNDC